MKLHTYQFELTTEESEHVYQALSKLLQNNLMSIMDVMVSDKTEDVKKSEIRWYIDNSVWFVGIMKKIGFEPNFDETITRLRKTHNLTSVEPDTTTSQPVNPECGAG